MLLSLKTLQSKIGNSELGKKWMNDPLMNQDIWSVEELGYTEEESKINGTRNIYFDGFSLGWLKLLSKLTIKACARQRFSLPYLSNKANCLRHLDIFLVTNSWTEPSIITDSILQQFISSGAINERKKTLNYVTKLWKEEQWLVWPYTYNKIQKITPKLEIIPEEVLQQIYENFDLFPPPLERLFRLQLVLGCRIGEMLKMPRQCLKQEENKWFLLRWLQKQKIWKYYQIHSAVAELVREQQKFLNTQLGFKSDFDKLFCKISTANTDGAKHGKRFSVTPVYFPEIFSISKAASWLKDFSKEVDLKDKQGNPFNLQSHMFRRTKASIMAYCETQDEYIAAVLGHSSLDMLPHYRKRSLERLEKEANAKGYVDMYGRVTSFKPRKRRYEKLAEIMEIKVSTALGECHKPTMLGDCQYRYACLGCNHHRVTLEDKPKLEADIKNLKEDIAQAESIGQERRVTEINRLLVLLKTRLQGLDKLEHLKGNKIDEQA